MQNTGSAEFLNLQGTEVREIGIQPVGVAEGSKTAKTVLDVDRQNMAVLAAKSGLLHCKTPLTRENPWLISPVDGLPTNG